MDMDDKKIWCPKCGTPFEIEWIIKTAEKLKELRRKSIDPEEGIDENED